MGRGKLTPQDLEDMKVISSNIQRLLTESGMNQSQLASVLNIPKSSLNEYVKGRTLPKAGNIQKSRITLACRNLILIPDFLKVPALLYLNKFLTWLGS